MPAAANSDRLVAKFGSSRVVSTGLTLVALGMILFTTVTIDTEYIQIAVTFFLLGFGMGLLWLHRLHLSWILFRQIRQVLGVLKRCYREIGGPWNCYWRFGVKRILPT